MLTIKRFLDFPREVDLKNRKTCVSHCGPVDIEIDPVGTVFIAIEGYTILEIRAADSVGIIDRRES